MVVETAGPVGLRRVSTHKDAARMGQALRNFSTRLEPPRHLLPLPQFCLAASLFFLRNLFRERLGGPLSKHFPLGTQRSDENAPVSHRLVGLPLNQSEPPVPCGHG